jgi:DNA-binding CsgD family transcriptional regulator
MTGSDQVKPDLTERQLQIVVLIARGCSNDEVGERLGISPRTAKAHCDVLRQKLGVPRRRQIPAAFKALTGEDPLARSLRRPLPAPGADGEPACSRRDERAIQRQARCPLPA